MQGQLLLAREMLIQRRIGVAALLGDVTNAGRGEPALAEQLHRGAEDLSLGRRIILANVEGKRAPSVGKLAYANRQVKTASCLEHVGWSRRIVLTRKSEWWGAGMNRKSMMTFGVATISISRNDEVVAVILGNPVMIGAYQAGIPGNGQPVPDGAKMAKVHWTPKQNEFFPDATVPGSLLNVDFMVKDSKRFADSGGWG